MKTETKIFKCKLTPALLALSIAVLALCGAGIGISIWRIVQFGIHSLTDVIKYPFLIAVCVFCIVLEISIYCKTQYAVNATELTVQFGFIRSRYALNKITALVYDRDTNKLSVYFGEEFILLSVAPDWQEAFVRALMEINPAIDYSFTLADVPNEKKDKDEK